MKGILEFNLEEAQDKEMFKLASNGLQAHLALNDLETEIFRPIRKYGALKRDSDLDALLTNPEVRRTIEILEEMYKEILAERNINLEGL